MQVPTLSVATPSLPISPSHPKPVDHVLEVKAPSLPSLPAPPPALLPSGHSNESEDLQRLAHLTAEVESWHHECAAAREQLACGSEYFTKKLCGTVSETNKAVQESMALELKADRLEMRWRDISAEKFGGAVPYAGAAVPSAAGDDAVSMCCDEEDRGYEAVKSPKRKRGEDEPSSGSDGGGGGAEEATSTAEPELLDLSPSKKARTQVTEEEHDSTVQGKIEKLLAERSDLQQEVDTLEQQVQQNELAWIAVINKENSELEKANVEKAAWSERIATLEAVLAGANVEVSSALATVSEMNGVSHPGAAYAFDMYDDKADASSPLDFGPFSVEDAPSPLDFDLKFSFYNLGTIILPTAAC